jgi:hypothetical protein
MSSTFSNSPYMLIPDIVALNSETDPSRPFYIYANSDSTETITITHLDFFRATQRAANLLRPRDEALDSQVIGLMALSDTVLYHATVVGLMTANFIVRACFQCAHRIPIRLCIALSHFSQKFASWHLPAPVRLLVSPHRRHLCDPCTSLGWTSEAHCRSRSRVRFDHRRGPITRANLSQSRRRDVDLFVPPLREETFPGIA